MARKRLGDGQRESRVGRPLAHGAKLEPVLCRLPISVRDELQDLATRANVSRNEVLLLAVVEWLKTRPAADRVERAVNALDLATAARRTRTDD